MDALGPAFVGPARRSRDEVAVGLGVILEPGTLASHPLRLEWWQRVPGSDDPVPLEVDLHPDSLGFYDYVAADWFAVPRRTRARHVVGPYVDVHGTDGYMLTFTMPMEVAGRFVGVAGADVPVTRFESMVLGRLGDDDAVLVNAEGRVVLSTSSRWITGCLLPEHRPDGSPAARRTVGAWWRRRAERAGTSDGRNCQPRDRFWAAVRPTAVVAGPGRPRPLRDEQLHQHVALLDDVTGATLTARTEPATSARTGISIFIDSRSATVSPTATASPASTATLMTLATISATISVSCSRAMSRT